MRSARPPEELRDIGVRGEFIAPLLHRLCTTEPKRFAAFKRTLRALIPSVQDLAVDLDKRRGTLDIQLSQYGTQLSSRIMSEGTLPRAGAVRYCRQPVDRILDRFRGA